MIDLIILFYRWLAVAILLEVHHNAYVCELPDVDSLHPYDVEFHCIEQSLKCDRWLAVANELHSSWQKIL